MLHYGYYELHYSRRLNGSCCLSSLIYYTETPKYLALQPNQVTQYIHLT